MNLDLPPLQRRGAGGEAPNIIIMKTLNLSKLLLLFLSSILISCDKEYLEKINDKSLLVPSTMADFQALLDDNRNVMNLSPWIGEISSDNFYASDAGYLAWNTELERSAYTWSTNPNSTGNVSDWNNAYRQIFYTNIVLDGLPGLKGRATETELRHLHGSALFYRGYALYNLSQVFAAPYDAATSDNEPGIPIRLSADVNLRPGRGTLAETYQQILKDIKEAGELLPEQVAYKSRPSQAAAFAMLARIALSMRNYEEAFNYADQCLAIRNNLIDYNTLNLNATRAFPVLLPNGNDEVIYYSVMPGLSMFSSSLTYVDSLLYKSYSSNDLRKNAFFLSRGANKFSFRGSYTGRPELFSGLATDELYLIRAECLARKGNTQAALADLNTLLSKRWKSGTYVPITASSADNALNLVLIERRKELLIRGLRWSDLRRLNTESRFELTLQRKINNQTYTLPAQDKRYVLLIPDEEVTATGIAQNAR